ncbi:MAG: glycoside hydrolase 43 family protein [Chitinophagaceae bacterium]
MKQHINHYINIKNCSLLLCFIFSFSKINAQQNSKPVAVTNYQNPIIHADYSDPDAIRVGNDYYMTASSFNNIPGLPILHSTDLVHWEIINYAIKKLEPAIHYNKVQNGCGVWAPAIRYHNGEFYIYYPDPDFGIYLTKTKDIKGSWSEPVLVQKGKGLIDPCPLWDDDGKCYLVHAYAGSRAGFKSILVVKEMNKEGTKIIGEGVMVYDGHQLDPTVEGPKFYKRNGYYYIFAPAGGVGTGWQIVLKSKNIYGPYERKIVMQQGKSTINGPHQGAWVNTPDGKDWFLHFQDKDAYGRIVHLQPMKWVNDFPVIGSDKGGVGEPVDNGIVNTKESKLSIAATDEFNKAKLGLQWQWQANEQEGWAFATPDGFLRIFSVLDSTNGNLYYLPNILTQKLPAETFSATAKLIINPKFGNEKFGLAILGNDYAHIAINKLDKAYKITYAKCLDADKNRLETEMKSDTISNNTVYLKLAVTKGAICNFSYSIDGTSFTTLSDNFIAKPGRWVGAKMGFFFTRKQITNDAGFVDIDWFRVTTN